MLPGSRQIQQDNMTPSIPIPKYLHKNIDKGTFMIIKPIEPRNCTRILSTELIKLEKMLFQLLIRTNMAEYQISD